MIKRMSRTRSKEMDQEDKPGKKEARLLSSRHSSSSNAVKLVAWQMQQMVVSELDYIIDLDHNSYT